MKVFALFNNDGGLEGFWSNDLFPDTADGNRHEKIPADAVEIDTDTHKLLVEYPNAWRMIGGTLSAYTPPEPTIEEVRQNMMSLTPRQLRLALVRSGTSIATVEATLDALPDGETKEEAKIEWEYATVFERVAPALLTIANALGFTPSEVDALWGRALTI